MATIETIANALIDARRSRRRIPAADLVPENADAAYAVQAKVADALGWFASGTPRHWKSGGATLEAITHAPLPPAGVWSSPAHAGDWPFGLRGIEAEVALRLGTNVDGARAAALTTAADAGALIDAMCVSIEVVDARWLEGPSAPPLAKLADLQLHGALVLGRWIPFEARDWGAQRCEVQIGTQPRFERAGSHSLGDPSAVLPAWLRHATRNGTVLAAGTVVTTGTWCGLLQAEAGDAVQVVFDGIGEAQLQF